MEEQPYLPLEISDDDIQKGAPPQQGQQWGEQHLVALQHWHQQALAIQWQQQQADSPSRSLGTNAEHDK